jgi:N-acetylmuramic acid 6-phosphate etherase
MRSQIESVPVLAFEGGATHTKAGVVENGVARSVGEGGPCNPTAYGIAESVRGLIAAGEAALRAWDGPPPRVGAIGSAGAVDAAQKRALGVAVCRRFKLERVIVATDLHPLLLANAWDRPGILAIAGTGSNVLARDAEGHMVQVGGRGTLLGDDGSGYKIASEALRHAARAVDGWGPATTLVEALPASAGVVQFDALISWGAAASKRDIAALSQAVFRCADAGDAVALACIEGEAALLAQQVLAAATRLGVSAKGLTEVFGVGGLFDRYKLFVSVFNHFVFESGMVYTPPPVGGPAAVAVLARLPEMPDWAVEVGPEAAKELPGTESAPLSPPLDNLDAAGIVHVMLSAEAGVAACLARCESRIAGLLEAAVQAIGAGGRLLYFGAGTSGRLGVLDASECWPTFGVGEETIAGYIAGGDTALRHAVEGAEDDVDAGRAAVAQAKVGTRDLVIGIAASGRTPYVAGALVEAKARGAATAIIACVDAPGIAADQVIALDTGPEALPGSTRLKAGTATKIVLNTISTGAMALSGRVFEGRMVAMPPTNAKLRQRAARIVAEISGIGIEEAERTLETTGGDIRTAILMHRLSLTLEQAQERLRAANGNLRAALGVSPKSQE